jgi:hypothetical protein
VLPNQTVQYTVDIDKESNKILINPNRKITVTPGKLKEAGGLTERRSTTTARDII